METVRITINDTGSKPPVEKEVTLPCYRKSEIGVYRIRKSKAGELPHRTSNVACDGIIFHDLFLQMSCSHYASLAFQPNTSEATEQEWLKAKQEVLTKLSKAL